MTTTVELNPQNLVWAYCRGVFPMADSRRGTVNWYCPDPRAILPLEGFHASHSLRRRVRQRPYKITSNRAFKRVMSECAAPRGADRDTWINEEIIESYSQLHDLGLAHSIEAWEKPDGVSDCLITNQSESSLLEDRGQPKLLGGLYGVSLGGAFFGESMFSHATDASKICLVHLVEHMKTRGFVLLDVQFNSKHMEQFGVIEVPVEEYQKQLNKALALAATWADEGDDMSFEIPR